jgi:muramidase (phage lysozyme)
MNETVTPLSLAPASAQPPETNAAPTPSLTPTEAGVDEAVQVLDSSPFASEAPEPPPVDSSPADEDEVAAEPQAEVEPEFVAAQPITLRLSLIDFAGIGIAGLPVRIEVNGVGRSCATDALGHCPEQSDLLPGSSLEISVQKDDRQWKQVYAGTILHGDMDICGVSPSIKIPIRTEPHDGQPVIKQAKPVAKVAAATPLPNAPPLGTPKTGGKEPSVTPTSTRNEAGNPVARIRNQVLDWAGRVGIPTLGLWRWSDFKVTTGAIHPLEYAPAALSPATGKAAAQPVAPAKDQAAPPKYVQPRTGALPAVALKVASLDQAPPAELSSLLKIMQEQIEWDWKKAPLVQNSELILSDLAYKKLGEPDTKSETESKGACYKSVKIALKRANYVSAINGEIPAKTAGPWLQSQGFSNVTAQLPDARWAWPGDVIVYRYTDEVEAKNDAKRQATLQPALKKYEQDKSLYGQQRKEFDQAKSDFAASKSAWAKEHPGKPFNGKFNRQQPKAPKVPDVPDVNYGHIDVRSYESYLSDFHPKSNALPTTNKFVVTGVYRKISDPLPEIRLRAFLKVLREWECHEETDDAKRYFMLLKPINGVRRFSDTSRHPHEGISKNDTAAGAYQITLATYGDFVGTGTGIPRGFTPAIQDRIAVAILESPPREGMSALALVRLGRIADAAGLLSGRWSSLPNGKHPRKEIRGKTEHIYTMHDLLERHRQFMQELIGKD